MKIKNIVIVGGGTSGWMTASIFAKYFEEFDINVSIVESPTIPTVGVGESTLLQFNRFLNCVGLEDGDWMKKCHATYKNSIKFTDFKELNHSFEYPFGGSYNPQSIFGWSQVQAKFDLPDSSFAQFMNADNYLLAEENRQTNNQHKVLPNFVHKTTTAYHFDAKLFANYLRDEVCLPNGIVHHMDDIVGVEKDDEGYVTSVVGESGKYDADLFIDCTGFRSLLLEQEMESEFLSFKPWLCNDKAIATHIPYTNKEEQLTNYTNCTGLDSGWAWNIPLWDSMGVGYVYSSDFVDDDTAEMQLKQHLGVDDADFNKINIRHGVHKNGWVKNVIGVGLAYGFVEPLESTSLVSTHQCLDVLIELLQRKKFNISRFDIDGYNLVCSDMMLTYRDFVSHHYRLSSRTDTPYWKYLTQEKDYYNLGEGMGFYPVSYDVGGVKFNDAYEMLQVMHAKEHIWDIDHVGISYIMAGMGYRPMSDHLLNVIRESDEETDKKIVELFEKWTQHYADMQKFVKTLPSSHQFLRQHIYGLTEEE